LSATRGNLLVLQGGGPTPVLNTSLFGVIDEARKSAAFDQILGARSGVVGLIKNDLVDLSSVAQSQLELLRVTPGASLGSTRHRLEESDLAEITKILDQRNVRALIVIGGNGSLRGCELIAEAVKKSGGDTCVVGVPKTIDNDIPGTDRCPGYGSAARYAAQAVRDLGMDVRGLPQPVSIYETMGRSTGWLAGAKVLGRINEKDAPHLVYLPERPFAIAEFLSDIDNAVKKHGWAVAVVTEGIKNSDGSMVYENTASAQRDAMNRAIPGGVALYLAGVVAKELKIRCRFETPGLCGRSSALHLSEQDLVDAELVGRMGVRAALDGRHAHWVTLKPIGSSEQSAIVPLANCAGADRHVPQDWLAHPREGVSAKFVEYARPIVGKLIDYAIPLKDTL
jgi:6-phosphofructokinase 1